MRFYVLWDLSSSLYSRQKNGDIMDIVSGKEKKMNKISRKITALITSVLTVCTLTISTLYASAAEARLGDATGDGKVDLFDVVAVCRHLIKKPALIGTNLTQADYNMDGKTNLFDAISIARFIIAKKNIDKTITLVNKVRTQKNLSSFIVDHSLTDAAMKRASELPKRFSGDYRPDNSSYQTVFAEYGISYEECATCVAAAVPTPEVLLSEMIKRNDISKKILGDRYEKIGVGYWVSSDDYKYYWTILLIK